jgi:uncharacterized protein YnzC (UPF0291/DUF896 family)
MMPFKWIEQKKLGRFFLDQIRKICLKQTVDNVAIIQMGVD